MSINKPDSRPFQAQGRPEKAIVDTSALIALEKIPQ
jgi:hypothetical protein